MVSSWAEEVLACRVSVDNLVLGPVEDGAVHRQHGRDSHNLLCTFVPGTDMATLSNKLYLYMISGTDMAIQLSGKLQLYTGRYLTCRYGNTVAIKQILIAYRLIRQQFNTSRIILLA